MTYTTAVKITLGAVAHEEFESISGLCQTFWLRSPSRINLWTDWMWGMLASCRRIVATDLQWQKINNMRIISHCKTSKRRNYQICAYLYTPRWVVYPAIGVQFFKIGKPERKIQCRPKHKRNIQARSCIHCCRATITSITYSESVYVALCIQHVKCTRRIILSCVVCLVLHIFFPHYLKTGTTFGEKKVSNIKCVFRLFSATFIRNILILRRIWRDKIINIKYIRLHANNPSLLSDLDETWNCSTIFEKFLDIEFQEIPSNGSRAVPRGRTDRRTDMTKLVVAIRNLARRLNSMFTNWLQDISGPINQ